MLQVITLNRTDAENITTKDNNAYPICVYRPNCA